MRATLRDDALASYAGRFVWLEMNYDSPRNAKFLASHMDQGFPLLLIVSPAGEVEMAWSGGATVTQLRVFLDEALAPTAGKADDALRHGDALLGANDAPGALAAYSEALRLGGEHWPRHDHAVEQLVGALQIKDSHECAVAAAERAPLLKNHPFVNVALLGMACAYGDPATLGTPLGAKLEALGTEALASDTASEDDRYMLFESLTAARIRAGDPAGSRALAEKYLALVEHMPPPRNDDERLARDLARLRAALKLGTPERIIPALEATERAVPRDDNPSEWLATAYSAANRWDDAIAACTRGLARAHGPTGIARLRMTRAAAYVKKGDPADARKDLEAALAAAKEIPVAPARVGTEAQVRKKLEELKP